MAAFRAMWERRLGPVIAASCLRGRARQAGRPIPWGVLSGPVIPATFSGVSDPAPPCATGRSWCGASHRVAVRLQREPPMQASDARPGAPAGSPRRQFSGNHVAWWLATVLLAWANYLLSRATAEIKEFRAHCLGTPPQSIRVVAQPHLPETPARIPKNLLYGLLRASWSRSRRVTGERLRCSGVH